MCINRLNKLILHFITEMASNKTYNGIDLIEQLLFIDTKKGEFRGFKQDFLLTSLNEVEKEFYVCTKCNGLMRNACRIGEEELLVCELCSDQGDKPQPTVKFRKKILELRVKCPLERRGCSWKGTIAEIKTHLDVCLEFVMNCTNKCDAIMKRSDLMNHCKIECQNRKVNCKHCNVKMKFKMLKDHYKTCMELPLLCPNECMRTFTRKEVALHIKSECPNTLLNCENKCGRKLKQSEMQNHHKNECQNRKIHCIQCSVIIQYKEIDTHNGTCPEFSLLCPNECKRTFTRKNVELHVNNECVNTLLNCENECGLKLKRCKMQNHYKNECQNRKIHCRHCSVLTLYKDIETHNGICPEFPLLCPIGCMGTITRKGIELHVNNKCVNTLLNCENECGLKLKRCKMQNHYKNECQNRKIHCKHCSVLTLYKEIDTHNGTCTEFPLLCPNECLKNLSRKELETHIGNECPNTTVACPYKEMGCKETMKRRDMEEHEKRYELKHLKTITLYFSNKVNQMEASMRSQERTNKSLENSIKRIDNRVEELSDKIANQEKLKIPISRPIPHDPSKININPSMPLIYPGSTRPPMTVASSRKTNESKK